MDLVAIKNCFKNIPDDTVVQYRLVRNFRPEMVLDKENPPECLRRYLPVIPVPREVFFQARSSAEDEGVSCYSARLLVEADKFLEVRLPVAKVALELEFPVFAPMDTGTDILKLLTAWVLTPFFDEDENGLRVLPSKVVPESICRACFGKSDRLLRKDKLQAPEWP